MLNKYLKTLDKIRKECEEIKGHWNGDEAELEEDISNCANNINIKVGELVELLEEMDNL